MTNDSYVVSDVVNPDPYVEKLPIGEGIDITPYFKPPQPIGQFYVLQSSVNGQTTTTEDIQHQQESNGDIYIVKNSLWEQLRVEQGFVWRGIDISPNEHEYYSLSDPDRVGFSRWCPSTWQIGDVYLRSPEVSFYHKSSCLPSRTPYTDTSYLKFRSLHTTWSNPTNSITLNNVIELWFGYDQNVSNPVEKYWYAENIGMVQWQDNTGKLNYISEIPQGREPLTRQPLNC